LARWLRVVVFFFFFHDFLLGFFLVFGTFRSFCRWCSWIAASESAGPPSSAVPSSFQSVPPLFLILLLIPLVLVVVVVGDDPDARSLSALHVLFALVSPLALPLLFLIVNVPSSSPTAFLLSHRLLSALRRALHVLLLPFVRASQLAAAASVSQRAVECVRGQSAV
jgi:hypothetical protein